MSNNFLLDMFNAKLTPDLPEEILPTIDNMGAFHIEISVLAQ